MSNNFVFKVVIYALKVVYWILILPLIIPLFLMYFIGNFLEKITEETKEPYNE